MEISTGCNTIFHDDLRYKRIMTLAPEQRGRLELLRKRAEELGIEGLFATSPEEGLGLDEMAAKLWTLGYIAVPTKIALLEAMEKEMQATGELLKSPSNLLSAPDEPPKPTKTKSGGRYVFRWRHMVLFIALAAVALTVLLTTFEHPRNPSPPFLSYWELFLEWTQRFVLVLGLGALIEFSRHLMVPEPQDYEEYQDRKSRTLGWWFGIVGFAFTYAWLANGRASVLIGWY